MSIYNKNVSVDQSYSEREALFWLLISKTIYNGIRKNIIIATLYLLSELQYFMKFKGLSTCEWQVNLPDLVYEI